jgi:hypothetical protein
MSRAFFCFGARDAFSERSRPGKFLVTRNLSDERASPGGYALRGTPQASLQPDTGQLSITLPSFFLLPSSFSSPPVPLRSLPRIRLLRLWRWGCSVSPVSGISPLRGVRRSASIMVLVRWRRRMSRPGMRVRRRWRWRRRRRWWRWIVNMPVFILYRHAHIATGQTPANHNHQQQCQVTQKVRSHVKCPPGSTAVWCTSHAITRPSNPRRNSPSRCTFSDTRVS